MNNIVISVENLSKSYNLGQIGTGTFSRDLEIWFAKKRGRPNPFQKIGQSFKENHNGELFYALKNINFQVQQGEVIGIIGRNGAGKSTLLKVLSRVTAPSKGQIKVKGRISSLLEVGTGFHPELTGRENIFLNGAILGMSKLEIRRKLDEIVSFSEVEKFIDTPVKRFSSGMYVRLAFAVAAHLESEILLVDEVLAVGDLEFQKKCLGKMGDVATNGRSILFVSHNMGAINKLCKKANLLTNGEMKQFENVETAVEEYMNLVMKNTSEHEWESFNNPGDDFAKLISIKIQQNGKSLELVDIEKRIFIEIKYKNYTKQKKVTSIIKLFNSEGICVFTSNDWNNKEWWNSPRIQGNVLSRCIIPENFLAEGKYYVTVGLGSYNPNMIHALEKDIISFEVIDNNSGNSSKGDYVGNYWEGVVRPLLVWEVEHENNNFFNI